MTTTEVAALADRLSKAQREALIGGTEIGAICRAPVAAALVRKGLAFLYLNRPTWIDWTEAGLAVRNHLLASGGA